MRAKDHARVWAEVANIMETNWHNAIETRSKHSVAFHIAYELASAAELSYAELAKEQEEQDG